MPITTCIFDAYGTLFDVAAAARQAASEPEFTAIKDDWPQLAEHWRLKQLQYSWLRAITSAHCDFWQVTQDGLDWALEKAGHNGDDALRARLLALYWELGAYPEVPAMLQTLKEAGLNTAILSNGSPSNPMHGSMTWSAPSSAARRKKCCSSLPTVGMQRRLLATALQPHGSTARTIRWTAYPGAPRMS